MYYYEKDYIMRLIHGIARVLARILFGRKADDGIGIAAVMTENALTENDYLRRMVDSGQINAAENRLFDLIASASWDNRQKAALALSFYDDLNSRDDAFLAQAGFPREEIVSGLHDAMEALQIPVNELLQI